MALTVIGIFDDASDAQQAVEALVNKGFSRSNIDVSAGRSSDTTYSDGTGSGSTIPDRHVNTSGTRTEEFVDDTKDVGSGIGNFFSSLFGGDDDNDDNRKYSTVASQGSIVTVHATTEDEAEQAADILDEAGAVDVNERAATYGYTGSTGMGVADTTQPVATTNADQTIKVIREDLEVGKRTVETGGVRVRSRVVSRPVEESVRLREERVIVQRNPVSRTATAADLNAFQEGQIELTERAEVPVVSKTANVVEEISVGKEVTEREEVIRDTVRNTEVDVENLGSTDKTVRTDRTGLSSDDDVTYSTK
ncbi:YsnF/AvaK domain-containing protein [Spirosoma utsteinense]|uniref:DUF2382 domain-containing protein n=1 Tax=Spirosoma utsteinense TaxID=2585773 RepID=A0ABR6W828_9BACT|nr:YsnF/AvaK domain-containing protein [Spirosoma utsteinense]MBC3784171.1 putative protein (TIGR02271 family) [Spirosoma utsteinense]MBC3792740.1 putative protein (TIGR02271 family) [Spirosoma utsteinense]